MTMNIEKHSFKISIGIAVTVILFLIAMTSNFASWKTEMEEEHAAMSLRQDHLSAGHASIRDTIDELEDRASTRDIQLAEINTKLVNIEVLLVEIKQDIRNK